MAPRTTDLLNYKDSLFLDDLVIIASPDGVSDAKKATIEDMLDLMLKNRVRSINEKYGDVNIEAGVNININTISQNINNIPTHTLQISAKVSNPAQTVNAVTGLYYTIQLSDVNNIITVNNTNYNTLILNNDNIFPTGSTIDIINLTTAEAEIIPYYTSTIVIKNPINSSVNKLRAQYSAATLVKVNSNQWILSGDLAP